MVNGLLASRHSHLSSWIKEILSPLSLEGLRFLTTYNLCCIEELLIEENGEYLPLPWLLKEDLEPGGPDVFKAVEKLLLAHGSAEMGGDFSIVREQCYMLFPLSYFRVAGILPDGRVSGRFYCPMPRFRTWLVLDASRPSQARGSGFDTSGAVSDLCGRRVRRAITCLGKHFWTVLHILETKRLVPPRPSRLVRLSLLCLRVFFRWLPSCGNRILPRFLCRQTSALSTQGVPLAQYLITQNWQLPTAPLALW
jgi:hypothetical protein